MKFLKFTPVFFLFFGLIAAGCDSNDVEETDMTPEPLGTIVDVAVAGGFNTLVAAVTAADLAGTLSGTGPFTVFAPTDAAFAKLPAGTIETLLDPANKDQLVAILTYHVVGGKVTSDQVVGLSKAPTLQGADVAIAVTNGDVMINDATVTAVDIQASNGVIHVIDTVLLPPAN
jgi:uncharacterized surface protein with fasciclin (FAS1) repeats